MGATVMNEFCVQLLWWEKRLQTQGTYSIFSFSRAEEAWEQWPGNTVHGRARLQGHGNDKAILCYIPIMAQKLGPV